MKYNRKLTEDFDLPHVCLLTRWAMMHISEILRVMNIACMECSNLSRSDFFYRVFSLTWPASMQIYWNKRKRLHEKRVELPEDWFGTPTWPPSCETLCMLHDTRRKAEHSMLWPCSNDFRRFKFAREICSQWIRLQCLSVFIILNANYLLHL